VAEPITMATIAGAVAAVLGYGALQQRVKSNTETIAKLATSTELELVHTSLDGRLERIENKLDKVNGNG